MKNEIFGRRIKELRLRRGLMQEDIATDLGFNRSTISVWEGGRIPKPIIMNQIADYFNVSMDYLMGRTDVYSFENRLSGLSEGERKKFNQFVNETEELIRSVGGLDEKQLEDIMRYMKYRFMEDREDANNVTNR